MMTHDEPVDYTPDKVHLSLLFDDGQPCRQLSISLNYENITGAEIAVVINAALAGVSSGPATPDIINRPFINRSITHSDLPSRKPWWGE